MLGIVNRFLPAFGIALAIGLAGGVGRAEEAGQLAERVRRGVVVVEKAGSPVAIGTVLAKDGRILTSLSGLGGADRLDVLYADGTTVHTKLGHGDPGLDLALLVPEAPPGERRTEGLTASEADPSGSDVRTMLPSQGTRLGPAAASVKGHVETHGRRGEALFPMLDVDVQGAPVVGAPLLDLGGRVVAVLVRACKGSANRAEGPGAWPTNPTPTAKYEGPCQTVVVGAPITAVRGFLAKAVAAADAAAPWLGIRGEPETARGLHGVRVVDVAPASPAQTAGLKSGEVIVAVDGGPIDQPDTLGEAIGKHAIGDSVKLLVLGEGKFREISVVLRHAP